MFNAYFLKNSLYNSQDMEATSMSTDKWLDKDVVGHIHNGILLNYKKKRIWVCSNEVDETSLLYSQKEKHQYSILTHIYGIRKMVMMILYARQQKRQM